MKSMPVAAAKTALPSLLIFLFVAIGSSCTRAQEEGGIMFKLDQPQRVSLAVYHPDGRKVRDLLAAEALEAGEHTVAFDGLDDTGNVLAAGQYEWRLIHHSGLKAEYVTSLGTSWQHMHWPAQHGGPVSVCHQEGRVWVSGTPEGSPQTVCVAADGSDYVWAGNTFFGWGHPLDTAVAGDQLWVLMSHMRTHEKSIWRQNSTTGKQPSATDDAFHVTRPVRTIGVPDASADAAALAPAEAAWDEAAGHGWLSPDDSGQQPRAQFRITLPDGLCKLTFVARDTADAPLPRPAIHLTVDEKWHGQSSPAETRRERFEMSVFVKGPDATVRFSSLPENWQLTAVRVEAVPTRLDANGENIAVLFTATKEVVLYDRETFAEKGSFAVPADARDVALDDTGTPLVVAGYALVRIAPAGQPDARTVLTKGLSSPQRVAVDADNGDILVYDAGESEQVKRFNRDGQLLATYGRPGGRRTGRYLAEDFRAVADLSATDNGGFVVVEDRSAPRRTAFFDRDGELVREWYGGQRFYTFGEPDPEDATRFWMMSQWGWVMEIEIDYDKGGWKPLATYQWKELLDNSMVSGFENAARFRIVRRDVDGDGQTERFIWSNTLRGSLLQVDEDAGVLRPFALMEMVPGDIVGPKLWKAPLPASKLPVPYVQALAEKGIDVDETPIARQQWKTYSWADADGQGDMDVDEITLYNTKDNVGALTAARFIDDEFNVYGSWRYGGAKQPAWWTVAPETLTEIGAPVWPWTGIAMPENMLGFAEARSVRVDNNGNVFLAVAGGGDGFRPQGNIYGMGHGPSWPASMVDGAGVICYRPDGELLWRSGHGSSKWEARNGRMHYPVFVAGFANGCVGFSDYIAQPCEVWTRDGLYVGGVIDGRVDDDLPQRVYEWWKTDRETPGDSFERQALLQYDMAIGGSLYQHDGNTYYAGAGWNNMPLFRVHGLDAIHHVDGTVEISAEQVPQAAEAAGEGLQATAYATEDFSGEPVHAWRSNNVWIDQKKSLPEPLQDAEVGSVQLQGFIEGRWPQNYLLAVYAQGHVQLTVGGEVVLDEDVEKKAFSEPVNLAPGKRMPITLRYRPAKDKFVLHLNWESHNQQIEHVPQSALYPSKGNEKGATPQ